MADLAVLFEHPEWQKPLLSALERRGVDFVAIDLKRAAFDPDSDACAHGALVVFNQASPSAYVRGHTRAVPYALSFMRSLERHGVKILNGADAFAFELSKSAQAAALSRLGIDHPKSLAFNDVDAAVARWATWPCLLKPEQGGSGARIFELHDADELRRLLDEQPGLWAPENLLLLQERFDVDPAFGIVRMEFLGDELLYAMRVVSHGAFNLCPSPVCNPGDGSAGQCEIPAATTKATPEKPTKPVEFFPYPEVPAEAVAEGRRIMKAGGLDVGGIEYLVGPGGRRVFYDVNANSNLRPAIAGHFGFDPFERVVDFLVARVEEAREQARAADRRSAA